MDKKQLAQKLGGALKKKGLTIATAESCTAGGIAAAVASVDGASEYFVGGVVSYATRLKKQLLGVTEDTLKSYGVVSRETAEAMNDGVRALTGADIAISITGYAGASGGDEFAQNGTVWICVGMNGRPLRSELLKVSSDRAENLRQAVCRALEMAVDYLSGS